MSDVQSNEKPLTLTTGRVIFAIAGVYVTQSLVSALSMQSLPALVRAAGGSLALAGATTLFMLPWALKFIWAPWIDLSPNLPGYCLPVSTRLHCRYSAPFAATSPEAYCLLFVLMYSRSLSIRGVA